MLLQNLLHPALSSNQQQIKFQWHLQILDVLNLPHHIFINVQSSCSINYNSIKFIFVSMHERIFYNFYCIFFFQRKYRSLFASPAI